MALLQSGYVADVKSEREETRTSRLRGRSSDERVRTSYQKQARLSVYDPARYCRALRIEVNSVTTQIAYQAP